MKYLGISVVFWLLPLTVLAGTISSGSSTPHNVQLTAPQGTATVKYEFGIQYLNNETIACGAKFQYSDSNAWELIKISKPMTDVVRNKIYSVANNNYSATLSGYAFAGLPACLGSKTAFAQVTSNAATSGMVVPTAPISGMVAASGKAASAAPASGMGATISLPTITSLTVTDAPNVIPPSYMVKVNGTGDVACSYRLEVFDDNLGKVTSGDVAIWSSKPPGAMAWGMSQSISKPVPLPLAIHSITIRAYGVSGGGNLPCQGKAQVSKQASGLAMTTISQVSTSQSQYKAGSVNIPMSITFQGPYCAYEVIATKAPTVLTSSAMLYQQPSSQTITVNLLQLFKEYIPAGKWTFTVVPSKGGTANCLAGNSNSISLDLVD